MSKTVKTVFGLLATIVAVFLIWQLVFNNGGILKTGYNNLANGINKQYAKIAGTGETLVPLWDATGADDNGGGFDINTSGSGGGAGAGSPVAPVSP